MDLRPPTVTLRTGRPLYRSGHGVALGRRGTAVGVHQYSGLDGTGGRATVWRGRSFHDITERRRAEQALLEAQTELEHRVQERTAKIQELESQRAQAEKLAARPFGSRHCA